MNFTLEAVAIFSDEKMNRSQIIAFHTRHKLRLLSHSQKHYRLMGQLVAHMKEVSLKDFYTRYETLLMASLSLMALEKNTLMYFST